jgi:type 2 lantibiotic biosynthesis protein LanM
MEAIAESRIETHVRRQPLPLPEYLAGRGIANCLGLFETQIHGARERVRGGAQSLARLYESAPFDAETIEDAMATELAERLLTMMARTMVLELNVARLEGVLEGATAEDRFAHFLDRLRDREIAQRLLHEYPVLVGQIEGALERWAEYSLEFLRHLCEDGEDLRDRFFDGNAGAIKSTRLGAGDSHRGGRSVIIVEFNTGARLVYKPRALAVDEHFNELLGWLNENGAEPKFRAIKSLDRGRHGWVEFVERTACRTQAEVKRFYRRQGAYLAVLYALEAADFHCENLIALGEHPMLVDLEALFHPRFERDGGAETVNGALGYSVLRAGLLPARFRVNEDSEGVDMSGLGSAAGQKVPRGVAHWERPDTDEMHLVKKTMEMPGSDNRPMLNGREANALDYADAIAEGFAGMYRIFLRHRDSALELVKKFAKDDMRLIVRGTHAYAMALQESYHPDVLRNAADRQELFRRFSGMDAFREAEIADLQRGDVPLFTTRPESRDVWTSGGHVIKDYFTESGLALVTRRIGRLSERDLERQLWIVRASLATLSSVTDGPLVRSALPVEEREAGSTESLAAACKIGDRLEELALGGEEVSWVGLTPQDEKIWTLAALESDLYDGLPGVILFLAYLGAVAGVNRYTRLAKAALKTLLRQMAEWPDLKMVGGFIGWGGLIYCLAHLGVLWRDEELLGEVERAVEKAAASIQNDQHLDVTGGVAGLGLALNSAYRATGSDKALETARECGKRLCATARKTEHGFGWFRESLTKRPLTGFAHGNAGIAYALLEIAGMTGERQFSDAAREAIEYERACFSKEHGNWPDFRENKTRDYAKAWCHGAPGIALSRLGALQHAREDALLRTEIETALETTLREGFGASHCLCHGDLGNADLLVSAARALRDVKWARKAKRIAGGILDRVKETGWICGNALGVESPGLMTGIAGIGYGLLRLAAPERVPSVLALEPPRAT